MTLETALLAALSAVTSALVAVVAKLWQRSEQCEKDRLELRETLERYIGAHSHAEGRLEAFDACPLEACPFRAEPTTKTARVPRFKPTQPGNA